MKLACQQGIGEGGAVVHRKKLKGLDPYPLSLEIVRIALGHSNHARSELLQHEGAGADAGLVEDTVFRGADGEYRLSQVIGEIRSRLTQIEHDVVSVRLQLRHSLHQRRARSLGILPPVHVDGVDHVLRRDGLAIVEFRALPELEGPAPSIVPGTPLSGEVRHDVTVRLLIYELAPDGLDHSLILGTARCPDVEGICRGASSYPDLEVAPGGGCGGTPRFDQAASQACGADCCSALKKPAPAHWRKSLLLHYICCMRSGLVRILLHGTSSSFSLI